MTHEIVNLFRNPPKIHGLETYRGALIAESDWRTIADIVNLSELSDSHKIEVLQYYFLSLTAKHKYGLMMTLCGYLLDTDNASVYKELLLFSFGRSMLIDDNIGYLHDFVGKA